MWQIAIQETCRYVHLAAEIDHLSIQLAVILLREDPILHGGPTVPSTPTLVVVVTNVQFPTPLLPVTIDFCAWLLVSLSPSRE